jgi:dihydropteroate synthase
MGILNCTPDSFSDGGRHPDPEAAVAHAHALLDEGADVVDVGGESTRPGAGAVSAEVELERVIPVIRELRRTRPDAVLSVDTGKARVAAAALAAGADMVNDVTAAADPEMLPVVAARGAGLVLMHMRGSPRTMQRATHYGDVVVEVAAYLRARARRALEAGLPADLVWLDPGIGFGKDDTGNLALLAALPRLAALGHPVLVGPSRKSFIGRLTGAGTDARLPGTLAAVGAAVGLERAAVRVHDPAAAIQYLEVAVRIREAVA